MGQNRLRTSYRGADKSLARPTSRCLFLMVRIFHLMLVLLYIYIYIYTSLYSTNIPPIMIINRICESNYQVYAYIVKHNYIIGDKLLTIRKAKLHVSALNVGHLQVVQ